WYLTITDPTTPCLYTLSLHDALPIWSFRLPLTQELIADALGLSIPYVNQVLRQLRDDGLVCIKDKLVVINDVEALSALADFERQDRKSTRLNSSHRTNSYAVFCLKKK